MNFTVDGGYTLGLLNNKYGPKVFYGLCMSVFLINMMVFVGFGFIDTPFKISFRRYI